MFKVLICTAVCCILFSPLRLCAKEVKSRYITLIYASQQQLDDLNDRLELTRKLDQFVRKKNILTVEDEVLAKIDTILEKAETVLDMFPDNLHIRVVLLDSADDVARIFKEKYGKDANHIAYYSLSEDTIYISVDNARLEVLAHEMGHAIVDHYFDVRPPYNIHELMAQFTEKHITD
ncbi:MAG: hypothetical protein ACD_75C01987G0003 [uncultured bacterium]|nr:MAG: hypothetical protein ACD_75C01987G0003 [uncultured bacterium]